MGRLPGFVATSPGFGTASVTATTALGMTEHHEAGITSGVVNTSQEVGGSIGIAVVGGITERPRVVDGRIAIREVLDLTVTVDHNVIDGAPDAWFVADLRRLIENAEVLPASDESRVRHSDRTG